MSSVAYARAGTREWRAQWSELGLILAALLFAGGAFAQLALVERGEVAVAYVRPWVALAVLALAGWGVLTWRVPVRDPLLFPITVLLCGWGLVEVARLQDGFLVRQTVWVGAGVVALLLIAAVPYRWYWLSRYRYLWLFSGLGLLGLTIIWGVNPLGVGDRLWLSLGQMLYFQPSELLKVLLVIFMASYLAEKRELLVMTRTRIGPLRLPPLPYLAPLLLMWGFSLVLLVWQQDLGAALLFFSTFLSMLYVTTGRRPYVAVGLGMFVLAAFAGYLVYDRIQVRGAIWLDPWSDPRGNAYQIVQSLLAFASGGLFGTGVGLGHPTPYIPVVHTDFVMAAIGEEWGMIGALGLILALLVLVARGLRVAMRARSAFVSLLAVGLSAMLGWQSLIIAGGTLKLIPLTGVTLPLVSYGGSSMLVSCAMIGLLLRASSAVRPGLSAEAPTSPYGDLRPALPRGPPQGRAGPHPDPPPWQSHKGGKAPTLTASRPGYQRPDASRPGYQRPDASRPGYQRPDASRPRGGPQGRESAAGGIERQIRELGTVLCACFLAVALGLGYWSLVRAPALVARDDNPRRIEAERRVRRGDILDRSGQALVRSEPGPNGVWERVYLLPDAAPVVGYASIDHGTGGVERAYDAQIRGERTMSPVEQLAADLLHLHPSGISVTLTIDTAMQRVGSQAMGIRTGAVVVMDVRNGEILALVSRPTYDPNRLEEDWPHLQFSRDKPFLNRATQGLYPPGVVFETLTLAAILEEGLAEPDTVFDDPLGAILTVDPPVRCPTDPPRPRFTLAEAYTWPCSVQYARLGLEMGGERLADHVTRLGVGRRIDLPVEVATGQILERGVWTDLLAARTAMGQGEVLVTPLEMALAMATIANDGLQPVPRLVLDVGGEPVPPSGQPLPVLSAGVARQVREVLAGAYGAGRQAAALPPVDLAGRAGAAESGLAGAPPHAWFIGYTPVEGPRYAIVVVVEHGVDGWGVAVPIAMQVLTQLSPGG